VQFETREGVNCMSGTMPPAAMSEAQELALARLQDALRVGKEAIRPIIW
jgi:hypothetical protein